MEDDDVEVVQPESLSEGVGQKPMCMVCYNMFHSKTRVPKSLQCGHTFCQECVQGILKNRRADNTAECPACRKNYKVDTLNPLNIAATNFTLREVLEQNETSEEDPSQLLLVSCSSCQKGGHEKDMILCRTCNIGDFSSDSLDFMGRPKVHLLCFRCIQAKHANHSYQSQTEIAGMYKHRVLFRKFEKVVVESKERSKKLKDILLEAHAGVVKHEENLAETVRQMRINAGTHGIGGVIRNFLKAAEDSTKYTDTTIDYVSRYSSNTAPQNNLLGKKLFQYSINQRNENAPIDYKRQLKHLFYGLREQYSKPYKDSTVGSRGGTSRAPNTRGVSPPPSALTPPRYGRNAQQTPVQRARDPRVFARRGAPIFLDDDRQEAEVPLRQEPVEPQAEVPPAPQAPAPPAPVRGAAPRAPAPPAQVRAASPRVTVSRAPVRVGPEPPRFQYIGLQAPPGLIQPFYYHPNPFHALLQQLQPVRVPPVQPIQRAPLNEMLNYYFTMNEQQRQNYAGMMLFDQAPIDYGQIRQARHQAMFAAAEFAQQQPAPVPRAPIELRHFYGLPFHLFNAYLPQLYNETVERVIILFVSRVQCEHGGGEAHDFFFTPPYDDRYFTQAGKRTVHGVLVNMMGLLVRGEMLYTFFDRLKTKIEEQGTRGARHEEQEDLVIVREIRARGAIIDLDDDEEEVIIIPNNHAPAPYLEIEHPEVPEVGEEVVIEDEPEAPAPRAPVVVAVRDDPAGPEDDEGIQMLRGQQRANYTFQLEDFIFEPPARATRGAKRRADAVQATPAPPAAAPKRPPNSIIVPRTPSQRIRRPNIRFG